MTDLKFRITEHGKAFVTFKPRADGGIILEVSGADVWSGKDGAEFALWLRDTVARITALEAQIAAADRMAESSVRLVDVAVRISEVDNDNRMLAEVAGTQADIAKFRAIRGGGNG